ncbi:cytochrome P450, partial [Backusella circina FSU 941]
LPPRAPGYLPVIGHLLQLAKPMAIQNIFLEWTRQVGPIFTCHFGLQTWIILNSAKVVRELIVERGRIYSSRNLPSVLVDDLFEGIERGGGFAFYPYGEHWRLLRSVAHKGLIKSKINSYQDILSERRDHLLSQFHEVSKTNKIQDLSHIFEHYTMTTILYIAYGNMFSFKIGDPVLHEAFFITERAANSISPVDQIRDFFPILKSFWPVDRSKYIGLRDEINAFYGKLLKQFKQALEDGCAPDCFVKEVIESNPELTEVQINHLVAIFIGAGSDTTAATLEWIVAYLANHPDIQDEAFREIQECVGTKKMPGIEHESQLSLVQCIIMETLRLRPPAPISIPHSTSQSDVYNSWHFNENTTIVINIMAVNQDPERFPNPTAFQPKRHLDFIKENQKATPKLEQLPHISFSTGRRVCVGLHLAERNLYMAVSGLLAFFKIEKEEAVIDVDTPKSILSATLLPTPYKVKLVPRY